MGEFSKFATAVGRILYSAPNKVQMNVMSASMVFVSPKRFISCAHVLLELLGHLKPEERELETKRLMDSVHQFSCHPTAEGKSYKEI